MEMTEKALRDYVHRALEHGFSPEHIKSALRHAGHSEKSIENAFHHRSLSKLLKYHKVMHKAMIAGLFVILIAKIFILAMITDQSVFNIFIGFLPTIMAVSIAVIIAQSFREHYATMWIVPLIFIGIYYAIIKNTALALMMDLPQILVFNLVVSYIFMIIITFITPSSTESVQYVPKPIARENAREVVREQKPIIREVVREQKPIIKEIIKEIYVPLKTQEKSLHLIEDKCKALNQVIGRVYKKKNGGAKELREKIKIPQEWYNTYDMKREENKDVNQIIIKILSRLNLLEQSEKAVFDIEYKKLKNLKRKADGSSKILAVLCENDHDPVEDYFKAAKEVCERFLKEK